MELEQHFDKKYWIDLSKIMFIKLMTFNCKRLGDVERTQLVEYENLQTPDEKELHKLSSEEKQIAQTYGRYITRGKLNSPAAVFVSDIEMKAIKMLQTYRHEAEVDPANPYLFATPNGTAEPFLKAAKALSDFCIAHNLQNKNLSATKLRKHLASETSEMDKNKQADISDFMGYAINIHNKIYKQPTVLNDILEIGKVLRDVEGKGVDHFDKVENSTFEGTQENVQTLSSSYNDEDIVEGNTFEETNFKNIPTSSANCSEEDVEEWQEHPVCDEISEIRANALQRYEECETSDDSDYIPDLSVIEEDEDHYTKKSNLTRKSKLNTPVFTGRKRSRRNVQAIF